MDIVSSIAASRLVAQQRAMDVIGGQHRQRQHAGLQGRARAVQRLAQPRRAARTAPPGGRTIAYTQDRATWREQQAGTLTHTGNPFDLAHHRRRLFHRRHAARPAADPRRPLRPDARRHAGRQQRQCAAGYQRQADPDLRPPTRRSPSPATARSPARTASSARSAWCRPTDPMQLAGRRRHAVPRRRADRGGRDARAGAGRDRGLQRPAGAGDDADDGRPAAVPVRQPVHPGRGRPPADRRSTSCCRRTRSPARDMKEIRSMRSLDIAGTGMQAQQTNVEVISNNIANMTHHRLQAPAGGVPGPDLPEPAPRRLQQLRQRHHRAVRRAGRARRARPRRSIASTSRATCSRPPTRWTWRSRATATSR